MAVFKIKYYDLDTELDLDHELTYGGPEMSERDTWHWAIDAALNWCDKNNACFVSVMNICM